MNLFDKIKDVFSNEDEKAAAAQAAEEQAAAEAASAEAQRVAQEEEAKATQEAIAAADAQRVADEVAAIEAQRQAEQEAADKAAADAAAAEAAAAPGPLSVAYVRQLIDHDSDPSVATGDAMDPVAGRSLETALSQVVDYAGPIDGALGTSFIEAYARFQQSLGYSGTDADGYPGLDSLTVLGERSGLFRAVD